MLAARATLFLVVAVAVGGVMAGPDQKISPALLQSLTRHPNQQFNVLISVKDGDTHAALNQVSLQANTNNTHRAQAVYDALNALTTRTQKNVLSFLASPAVQGGLFGAGPSVKSFWITNQVYVQGASERLIQTLAALEDVSFVEEEIVVQLEPLVVEERSGPGVFAEWGVDKILTEQAWAALGTSGEGVVVGIIDTGARATHQDLAAKYRGGTHSWFSAVSNAATPVDGNGHGTHCTGTILGASGLGVAPSAKFISCKGLTDQGSGTSAQLIACGQFMACPTDASGNNPDCSQAPDIVSNSWGGTGGQTYYDAVIRAWHAANIIPIVANGNYGIFDPPKACSYTASPADSAAGVIAVGATGTNDLLADFSYRGPSRSGAQSPQVSAPGVGIRSAWINSDSAYNSISGTSMAAPHVAGLVALLRSHTRNLSFDRVRSILQDTADRNLPSTGESCGGVPDTTYPNYHTGYGRVNALRAANALLGNK